MRTSRVTALVAVAESLSSAAYDSTKVVEVLAEVVHASLSSSCTVWLLSPATDIPSLPPAVVSQHSDELRMALGAAAGRRLDGDRLRQAGLVRTASGPALLVPLRAWHRLTGIMACTPTVPSEQHAGVTPATGVPTYVTGYTGEDIEFLTGLATVAACALDGGRQLANSMSIVEDLRRQSELLDGISDAIVACDPDGRVTSWNCGAQRLYGYSAGDALGCDLFTLLGTGFLTEDGTPIDRDDALDQMRRDHDWRGELHQRRADGEAVTVLASISDLNADRPGHPDGGLVMVGHDVSDQRREIHRALHDVLTDLPNRRMLINHLYDALARKGRSSGLLAVLFLDLDKFKDINDNYGHAVGDEVLRETARRLDAALRRTDLVARLGGDEFVAVLEDAGDPSSVHEIANRLTHELTRSIATKAGSVHVKASIGIALVDHTPPDPLTPEDILGAADAAMYHAKRNGTGPALHVIGDTAAP